MQEDAGSSSADYAPQVRLKLRFTVVPMALGYVHFPALAKLGDPLFHFRLRNVQARLVIVLLSQNTFMADRFSRFTVIWFCTVVKKHTIHPHQSKKSLHVSEY